MPYIVLKVIFFYTSKAFLVQMVFFTTFSGSLVIVPCTCDLDLYQRVKTADIVAGRQISRVVLMVRENCFGIPPKKCTVSHPAVHNTLDCFLKMFSVRHLRMLQ